MAITRKSLRMVFGILTLSAAPSAMFAATPMATFSVSATVLAGCQVSSMIPSYRSAAAAVMAAPRSVAVACNHETPYDITLGEATFSEGGSPVVGSPDIRRLMSSMIRPNEVSDIYHLIGMKGVFPYHSGVSRSQLSRESSDAGKAVSYVDTESSVDSITVVVTY